MRLERILFGLVLMLFLGVGRLTLGASTAQPVLAVVGLDDNAVAKDVVGITVTVDSQARMLFAYTTLMPWVNGTSYAVGTWQVRGSNVLRLRIDTRYLPEGPQALVFFTRDASGQLYAMRAFSIRVQNRTSSREQPASHIEIRQPIHGEVLKGGAPIALRRFDTGEVVRVDYHIYRLGDRWVDWAIHLPDGYWDIREVPSGTYAINAFAINAAGEIIDRSTVTVVVPPKIR